MGSQIPALSKSPLENRGHRRVSAHSHVRGLESLHGQSNAVEAAQLVCELVKRGRMSGRAILLAGPPGTGK
ncbi:MAG: hypothetical protein MHPSP_003505, partial [Paramarteilia canceri]